MKERGFLDGNKMATAFNMLRSGDLIWPYVINNYVRGRDPMPFDLLYWNFRFHAHDGGQPLLLPAQLLHGEHACRRGAWNWPAARCHSRTVKIPIYNLASREDHIAPARSAFLGSSFFGGDVEFVMAGSGHIAGVVNPPSSGKYQFWTGGKPEGDFEQWVAKAEEHPGSWWPHWQKWIESQDDSRVPARKVGASTPVLCDAPGEYVRVRV